MKRFTITITVFLVGVMAFADSDWHESDAPYRIAATIAKPEIVSCLTLGDFLVPGGWGNGVRVYNKANEKLDYYLSPADFILFIPPGIDNGEILVYFGFPSKQEAPPWPEAKYGKIGETRGLEVATVSARSPSMQAADREKQLEERKRKLIESQDKQIYQQRERLVKLAESLVKFAGSGIMSYETQLKAEEEKTTRLCQNKEKAVKEFMDRSKKEREDRERAVEKFFDKNASLIGKRRADEVFLDKTPFGDKESNFATRFKGLLVVKTEGNYVFAINSANNSLLKIDDKYVVGWDDAHEKTDKWEKTGEIALTAGLHELQFFYQQNDGRVFATAAWKADKEEDFKTLTAADFAPACIEGEVSPYVDRKGVEYPVISYAAVATVTFEDKRFLWDKLTSMASPGGNESIRWCLNEATVGKGFSADFFSGEKDNLKITVKSDAGRFPDYPLVIPRPFKSAEAYDPSIFIRFRDPSFIFDDETLEMSLEAYSELPDDIGLVLKTSASKANGVFINGIETLRLRKKNQAEKYKFVTPHVLKKNYKLNGAELKDGLDVVFNFTLPPLSFDRVSFRFIPVQECKNLKDSKNGIVDTENRRVIPVLHRPDLSEIRKWALLDYAMDKILPMRKVLVISDDFGRNGNTFQKKLASELSKRGISTEFLAWRKSEDQPYKEGFVSLMEKIRGSDADRAVIVPPSVDVWKGDTLRLEERIIAATLILMNENRSFRTVNLCTPLPSVFSGSAEKGTVAVMRKLTRDFGTELIDLNSFVRKRENWAKAYYENPDDSSMIEYFPSGMAGEIAEYISTSLK